MSLELFGFGPSVYTRVIKIVLHEKGLSYAYTEVDPFADEPDPDYLNIHPFCRVPALDHDGFVIFECGAIARYLDAAFPDTPLTPDTPKALARMAQVMQILDAYAYWPMVRQVFGQRVFRPHLGQEADPDIVSQGLLAAAPVLAALERIAREGLVLNGTPTLADCQLAPMVAAFCAVPDGKEMLDRHPAMAIWWATWSQRPSVLATDTGFDKPYSTPTQMAEAPA